jgi:hypothetical protein
VPAVEAGFPRRWWPAGHRSVKGGRAPKGCARTYRVSLVSGAARPWDAPQPARIEVDPRAAKLPWSRAAASV